MKKLLFVAALVLTGTGGVRQTTVIPTMPGAGICIIKMKMQEGPTITSLSGFLFVAFGIRKEFDIEVFSVPFLLSTESTWISCF